MKRFPLAKYVDFYDLYKAKSEYYQKLCEQLLDQLEMAETVTIKDGTDDWYWTATGAMVGDDIDV